MNRYVISAAIVTLLVIYKLNLIVQDTIDKEMKILDEAFKVYESKPPKYHPELGPHDKYKQKIIRETPIPKWLVFVDDSIEYSVQSVLNPRFQYTVTFLMWCTVYYCTRGVGKTLQVGLLALSFIFFRRQFLTILFLLYTAGYSSGLISWLDLV